MNMGGVVNGVLGGWRLGAIQSYFSGRPIALQRNNPLPIFNGTTRPTIATYDGWRAATKGSDFDPAVDRFLDINKFILPQPIQFCNATRFNPKVREFPAFSENISLAKSFAFTETRRIDIRWEAFNLLNHVIYKPANTTYTNVDFGKLSIEQQNFPRQIQVSAKLRF